MVDDQSRSQPVDARDAKAEAHRARYEPPMLRQLGSVNRLTLAMSNLSSTDGSKTKVKGV